MSTTSASKSRKQQKVLHHSDSEFEGQELLFIHIEADDFAMVKVDFQPCNASPQDLDSDGLVQAMTES